MDITIDSSLLDTPLGSLAEIEISNEFWGNHRCQRLRDADLNLSAFWAYYSKECAHALHDGGRHVAVRSHRDIIEVTRQLKADMSRDGIRQSLQSKLTTPHANEDELLDNSINLAASLLLMCDCGSSSSHGFSGRTEILWKSGSLRKLLVDFFGEEPVLAHEKVKLDRIFIARNLGRIAGVEIVWTDSLVDHLRLTDDDTKVHVFHQASFLEYQRQR